MLTTEQVVYLLRKTSLTRTEIGKLKPDQAIEILREVYFQESVDNYRNQHSVASLMAAIYNTIPRKAGIKTLQAKDFLNGDMPVRGGRKLTDVDILAKEKGIRLPSK